MDELDEQTGLNKDSQDTLIRELENHVHFASSNWFQHLGSKVHYVSREQDGLQRKESTNALDRMPPSISHRLLSPKDQVANPDAAFKKFHSLFSDQELGVPHIKPNTLFVGCFPEQFKDRTLYSLIAAGDIGEGADDINHLGLINVNILLDDENLRDEFAEKLKANPNETLALLTSKLIGINYEVNGRSLAPEKAKNIEVIVKKTKEN